MGQSSVGLGVSVCGHIIRIPSPPALTFLTEESDQRTVSRSIIAFAPFFTHSIFYSMRIAWNVSVAPFEVATIAVTATFHLLADASPGDIRHPNNAACVHSIQGKCSNLIIISFMSLSLRRIAAADAIGRHWQRVQCV